MDSTWRLELLARLAAERNYLLRQLWGLSETTLTTIPVMDDWTAKDILAHIAFWDGFVTERMSWVVNGRLSEMPSIGGQSAIDALNLERHQQFKNVPLEAVIATLLKERSGLHALLKRIPDHDLHRQLRLADGHRTRMKSWLRSRWRHDADHAQALAIWRKRLPDDLKRQRLGPQYLLRTMLQAARKEFLKTADLIPESERTTKPVCGTWTLKDLIGHLTDWEKVGLDGLQQLTAGQIPEFDTPIAYPFDPFNNKNTAVRQEQSWDEVWTDFTQTRQQFITHFDAMPESQFTQQFIAPWQQAINGYAWLSIWPGHDREHALDIRATLNLNHWPRRLKH